MHAEVLEVARNGAAVKKENRLMLIACVDLSTKTVAGGMFYYCALATFCKRFF